MPTISTENKEDLTAVLTVQLAEADYAPKVTAKLKEYRKKSRIKGFRAGKTPMSVVKKMYGNQVLIEEINEILAEEVNNYITSNKLRILGNPLPIDDNTASDFNVNEKKTYDFKYELGLAPEFELQGVDGKSGFEIYEVEVSDEDIAKEIEQQQKRLGNSELLTEGAIEEKDLLKLQIEELDGKKIKEGGISKEIFQAVDLIKDKKLNKKFASAKIGDSFDFDIFKLEDRDEKEIKKIILGVEEDAEIGSKFKGTILEARRQTEAELDQAFFDKLLGPDVVTSEAELKAELGDRISEQWGNVVDNRFLKSAQEQLLEKNAFDLPDVFLKKWLKIQDKELTDEKLEESYDVFAKDLKWTIIKGKLQELFDVDVTQEDLLNHFKEQVEQYFGGQGDDKMITETAQRLMSDQKIVEQRYQEMLTQKIVDGLKDKVKLKSKKITTEAFKEMLEKEQKANA